MRITLAIVITMLAQVLLVPNNGNATDSTLDDFKYTIGGSPNFVNWNNQAPGFQDFYIVDGATNNQGDAYDNAGLLSVCTTSTAGCGDGTFSSYSGAGTRDLVNNSYLGSVVSLNNLDVSASYRFSPTTSAARLLVKLTNNSASTQSRTIKMYTDLGCDGACYLYYESIHGNTQGTYGGTPATGYTTNSYWTITGDNAVPSGDPPTSFVYGTSGASVSPSTTLSAGIIYTLFNASVPANSTKYLMIIFGLAGITSTVHTVSTAYTGVANNLISYALLPNDLKADLTGTVTSNILNWAIGPFTSTTSIALAANATTASKRTPVQITATVMRPGRVTF
jgi:hypothetical protein